MGRREWEPSPAAGAIESMLTMRVHVFGERLIPDKVAPPEPGSGSVRLRVHACGVNFADMLMVQGRYRKKQTANRTRYLGHSVGLRGHGHGRQRVLAA